MYIYIYIYIYMTPVPFVLVRILGQRLQEFTQWKWMNMSVDYVERSAGVPGCIKHTHARWSRRDRLSPRLTRRHATFQHNSRP